MEIYHEAQSFLKTFLVFKNTHAQRTGSKNIRHWRKILISSLRNIRHKIWHKTVQTTENVERYERRRILILLESKSGNIERLLLRFVLKLTWKENLWSCWSSDTEIKSEFVWLVTKRSRVQGVPTLGTRTIIDPDPCRKASFTSRSAVVNYGSVFGLDIGI